MPVLCHNEKSVNLFTHTLCPTVYRGKSILLPFKSYPTVVMLGNFVGIQTNLKEVVLQFSCEDGYSHCFEIGTLP